MIKNLILIFLLAFAVAACTPQEQQKVSDAMMDDDATMEDSKDDAMMEDDSMMEEGDSMEKDDSMMEDDHDNAMEDDSMMEEGDSMIKSDVSFSGQVLAGNSSPLLEFNQEDYNKALSSGKLVVLYFYASWCPTCKAEFPKMQSAFDKLSSSDVVGFRVNFNDSSTNEQEKALAKEFGVAYQHTKVLLQNGERLLKAPDSWDEARYLSEINKLTN